MSTFVSVAAGVVTLWLFYKILFDDLADLLDCIKFWFTPDIISLFQGKFFADHWSELRLVLWIALGFLIGYGVNQLF